MEVTLPTGYAIDSQTIIDLKSNDENVKKVELKNGETVVVIYFDNLVMNQTACSLIDAFRVQKVLNQRPVPIVVYDYYESGKLNILNLIRLWHKRICLFILAKKSRTFYEKTTHSNCQGDFCKIAIPLKNAKGTRLTPITISKFSFY